MAWIHALTDEPVEGFKPRHEMTDLATYARIQFEVLRIQFNALTAIAECEYLDSEGVKRIAQKALDEVKVFATDEGKSKVEQLDLEAFRRIEQEAPELEDFITEGDKPNA
jgi:hypothetical protein